MDRYKTMQTFVQVAKYGSLTAAARSLGISRALVSRQITDLEHRLQVRLLNRSTRLVNLTEAGQTHFEFCERLLGEMVEESKSLLGKDAEIEGAVRIVAPEFAGDLDLGDALSSFLLQYPKVKIELAVGELRTHSGPVESVFDLILQTKPNRSPFLPANRVAALQYALCCSPDYLAANAALRTPRDLAEQTCLVHGKDTAWRLSRTGRSAKVTVKPAFSSNSFEVLAKAASSGLGIAPLPERLIRADLDHGTLVRVLPGWRLSAQPLYAVFTGRGKPPQRVRLVTDYLTKWFRPT